MTTGNRWGRAIGAGVLAELAIIVVIVAAMTIYTKSGTRSEADRMAFIHDAAGWIVCVVGPIATFLFARWAIRPLTSAHMAHALVVAGVAVAINALTSAGAVSEGQEALWVVVLAGALKVVGGVAAGALARRSAPA